MYGGQSSCCAEPSSNGNIFAYFTRWLGASSIAYEFLCALYDGFSDSCLVEGVEFQDLGA